MSHFRPVHPVHAAKLRAMAPFQKKADDAINALLFTTLNTMRDVAPDDRQFICAVSSLAKLTNLMFEETREMPVELSVELWRHLSAACALLADTNAACVRAQMEAEAKALRDMQNGTQPDA